jgi:hypothetical protein
MKKKILLLSLLTLMLLVCFVFFKKTYLDFDLVYVEKNVNETFKPDAYEFFHSKNEMNIFFNRNEKTKKIGTNCKINFDFEKYSYCIFYGCKIKNLYYSYKTTFFNDMTPKYARPNNKKVVFVEYGDNKKSEIYIYKISKDESLRGFYGI